MKVDGVEVSFSGESPGWQVTIEGDMASEKADALLQAVQNQVELVTGTAAEAVLISP